MTNIAIPKPVQDAVNRIRKYGDYARELLKWEHERYTRGTGTEPEGPAGTNYAERDAVRDRVHRLYMEHSADVDAQEAAKLATEKAQAELG